VRSRTAGVMTTLMRNGRDRRSGKPVMGHAILERALLVGTRSADHIRASGHSGRIATGQASKRKQAGYMAAPERFAKRQIPLAPRAPSIHGPFRPSWRVASLVVIGVRADMVGCGGKRRERPIASVWFSQWRIAKMNTRSPRWRLRAALTSMLSARAVC
jgi:hypothetical protein